MADFGVTEVIGIMALVGSAVGAGLQYSAAKSASADQSNLALMNAQAASQEANQQGKLGMMQAQINSQIADGERRAALANVDGYKQEAEAGTSATQINVQKTREDFSRMLAAQRVQAASSGVVDTTGSPLDLMTQTAEQEQRTVDTYRYQDETQRRSLFHEADNETRNSKLSGISALSAMSQGYAAQGRALSSISQSRLNLYGARAQSNAMSTQANAGLISSAGGIAGSAYSLYRSTPRTASNLATS